MTGKHALNPVITVMEHIQIRMYRKLENSSYRSSPRHDKRGLYSKNIDDDDVCQGIVDFSGLQLANFTVATVQWAKARRMSVRLSHTLSLAYAAVRAIVVK